MAPLEMVSTFINTLRPRQNGRHFADDIVKRIFDNENVYGSNRKYPSIATDNGLAPSRQQAIIWTNAG